MTPQVIAQMIVGLHQERRGAYGHESLWGLMSAEQKLRGVGIGILKRATDLLPEMVDVLIAVEDLNPLPQPESPTCTDMFPPS